MLLDQTSQASSPSPNLTRPRVRYTTTYTTMQGYHEFFRKRSKTSEPHDWEPFLSPEPTKFGDDALKASFDKATEDKVNEELKNLPAIYELAVVHPSRPKNRIKCFVGKCRDFQHCSRDMLTNSDHDLVKFFRLALQHGNAVVRRYVYYIEHAQAGRGGRKPVDVDCLIGKSLDRLLAAYDFPWNDQAGSGSGTRGIYAVPKNSLCCIPSGVDVIRIHPTMLK